jgi:hypothetical protein
MGGNIQGDEYIGAFISTNMDGHITYAETVYKNMSIIIIRDALRKYTFGETDDNMIIEKYNGYDRCL